jgi:hypothetical protein
MKFVSFSVISIPNFDTFAKAFDSLSTDTDNGYIAFDSKIVKFGSTGRVFVIVGTYSLQDQDTGHEVESEFAVSMIGNNEKLNFSCMIMADGESAAVSQAIILDITTRLGKCSQTSAKHVDENTARQKLNQHVPVNVNTTITI